MLPVHNEGIYGSGEDSDGSITGVKISCGQFSLVNILIEDCCNYIAFGDSKAFPNQLFE